jgi:hypothetical protein
MLYYRQRLLVGTGPLHFLEQQSGPTKHDCPFLLQVALEPKPKTFSRVSSLTVEARGGKFCTLNPSRTVLGTDDKIVDNIAILTMLKFC